MRWNWPAAATIRERAVRQWCTHASARGDHWDAVFLFRGCGALLAAAHLDSAATCLRRPLLPLQLPPVAQGWARGPKRGSGSGWALGPGCGCAGERGCCQPA